LIPSWAKDAKIAFSTINARAETVAEKPAFRDAFTSRRALVVADGFYEWKSEAGGKQPYLIERKDERPMAFAGLWERWQPHVGMEAIESFTIIVTSANTLISSLHDRMPVILDPAQFDLWLRADQHPPSDVLPLLKPYDPAQMRMRPVSRALNSVSNEGPALLDAPQQQELLL
jgi:putative SOS response-associated peptidase YedK